MSDFFKLRELLSKSNIDISDKQIDQFNNYYELLISWNDKINLTAITEYDDVLYKHFYDSLSMMEHVSLSGKKLLDVGTGAGFPGLPLAIMNPDCDVYLLDSLNKRINFLNEVIDTLCLKNVKTFHGRAEDYGFDNNFRECFDIVTSRAVANLSTLSEYCIPFTKKGGYFISYKSSQSEDEIKQAGNAINILGGNLESVIDYPLEYNDIVNKLVLIKKIKQTGKKYPRKAGTPSRSPL